MSFAKLRNFFVFVFAIVVMTGCNSVNPMQSLAEESGTEVKGKDNELKEEYIIIFTNQWNGEISEQVAEEVLAFIAEKVKLYGIDESDILFTYKYAIKGFAARLNEAQLELITNDPDVDNVSENQLYQLY